MPHDQMVSHGRGGVANIGQDSNQYANGEIVRRGPEGDQGDGAFSAGRGGVGNISSPKIKPAAHGHDKDVVPAAATRLDEHESHHFGRGGEGNVAHEGNIAHHHPQAESESGLHHEGLADKLKHKILGDSK